MAGLADPFRSNRHRQPGKLSQSQAAIDGENLARQPLRGGTRKLDNPLRDVVGNAAPCGVERLLSKTRQDDRFSLRSRSSRGIPLKPGYQCSGPQVRDISSPTDFMQVLIFRPA